MRHKSDDPKPPPRQIGYTVRLIRADGTEADSHRYDKGNWREAAWQHGTQWLRECIGPWSGYTVKMEPVYAEENTR